MNVRKKNWGCHDFKEGKIPFSNERELIKILNISVVVDAKSLSTRKKINIRILNFRVVVDAKSLSTRENRT